MEQAQIKGNEINMTDEKWVVVFDVDGVLTDGTFWQHAKKGKYLKRFGADDWDALDELSAYTEIHIITADKKGLPIVELRMKEKDMSFSVVTNKPPSARWTWIRNNYPNHKIIYVGDGIYDWYCLSQADYSIAPPDSLIHVKSRATYIAKRSGANRFVAEACLWILETVFGVDTWSVGEDDE